MRKRYSRAKTHYDFRVRWQRTLSTARGNGGRICFHLVSICEAKAEPGERWPGGSLFLLSLWIFLGFFFGCCCWFCATEGTRYFRDIFICSHAKWVLEESRRHLLCCRCMELNNMLYAIRKNGCFRSSFFFFWARKDGGQSCQGF